MHDIWVILATSGFWAVLSIGVGILSYILARKRFRLDERVDLSIQVNPTRMENRQMAQFRLHNNGKRPINIVGWGYGGKNRGRLSLEVYAFTPTATNAAERFPILLREQESCDFIVFVDEI